MMPVLESGGTVRMVETEEKAIGVETPDDLQKVQLLMEDDPLVPSYISAID